MTTLSFYWLWFKLGRTYWKARHLWTLMAYLENAPEGLPFAQPPRSVGDEVADYLADRQRLLEEDGA